VQKIYQIKLFLINQKARVDREIKRSLVQRGETTGPGAEISEDAGGAPIDANGLSRDEGQKPRAERHSEPNGHGSDRNPRKYP
jgi:hypothetical protein